MPRLAEAGEGGSSDPKKEKLFWSRDSEWNIEKGSVESTLWLHDFQLTFSREGVPLTRFLFLMLLFRLFLTVFALMQPITTESACVRLNFSSNMSRRTAVELCC